MSVHAVIDLETGGVNPQRALVYSIGIVLVDDTSGCEVGSLYANIDPTSQPGRITDGRTLDWWAGQSEQARAALEPNKLPLSEVLDRIDALFRARPVDGGVWGNDSIFDVGLVWSLYTDSGRDPPWRFSQPRCFRTLREQHGWPPFSPDTPHHALDDARAESKVLLQMLRCPPV